MREVKQRKEFVGQGQRRHGPSTGAEWWAAGGRWRVDRAPQRMRPKTKSAGEAPAPSNTESC